MDKISLIGELMCIINSRWRVYRVLDKLYLDAEGITYGPYDYMYELTKSKGAMHAHTTYRILQVAEGFHIFQNDDRFDVYNRGEMEFGLDFLALLDRLMRVVTEVVRSERKLVNISKPRQDVLMGAVGLALNTHSLHNQYYVYSGVEWIWSVPSIVKQSKDTAGIYDAYNHTWAYGLYVNDGATAYIEASSREKAIVVIKSKLDKVLQVLKFEGNGNRWGWEEIYSGAYKSIKYYGDNLLKIGTHLYYAEGHKAVDLSEWLGIRVETSKDYGRGLRLISGTPLDKKRIKTNKRLYAVVDAVDKWVFGPLWEGKYTIHLSNNRKLGIIAGADGCIERFGRRCLYPNTDKLECTHESYVEYKDATEADIIQYCKEEGYLENFRELGDI